VTMILVALAMVAIVGIAALSIDVVTLYLARQEAQRSADNAALAAAKIISLSGLTGDPANTSTNWVKVCGPDNGTDGLAGRVAKSVASQDGVGGQVPTTVNVTYSAQSGGTLGAGTNDCTGLATSSFGVNPIVTVQLTRSALPSFFSRIWGNTGNQVSATATAEAFNPSNSAIVVVAGTTIPVRPRCVKPWVVPNRNPLYPVHAGVKYCDQGAPVGACNKWVDLGTGTIQNQGVTLNGVTTPTGVIGETFWLSPDCRFGNQATCQLRNASPQGNYTGSFRVEPPPNLLYVPGQVGTTVQGVPSCSSGDTYEEAIEGCDAPTNYSCGVPANGNVVDTTLNPELKTVAGVQCLTHQTDDTNITSSSGQDYLNTFAAPNSYPFQMLAGSGNPTGLRDTPISASNSVVSLPIYDDVANPVIGASTTTNVTFVGFLQVFINAVDQYGNVNVTVLNVAGCSNNATGAAIDGNSPVPVRLITPP